MPRATDTGTGLLRPPSTSHTPLCHTGVKMPGIAIDARTASIVLPSWSQISRPVSSSVATAANGIFNCAIEQPANFSANSWITLRPPSRPPEMRKSSRRTTVCQLSRDTHSSSQSRSPFAYTAPTSAPIEVPHTTSGLMPASCNARIAPICAQPRAAPPPNTSPIRLYRRRRIIFYPAYCSLPCSLSCSLLRSLTDCLLAPAYHV